MMIIAPELWVFRTRNLTIILDALDENMDPADSFEFPEDIEAVRSGRVEWFCARIRVLDSGGCEVASDYLGGCAYASFAEFRQYKSGDYFTDMVREACRMARIDLKRRKADYANLRLREVAT